MHGVVELLAALNYIHYSRKSRSGDHQGARRNASHNRIGRDELQAMARLLMQEQSLQALGICEIASVSGTARFAMALAQRLRMVATELRTR